ncbi:MAG: hypothetical protein EXR72_25995 [Myxococcales bacterium]|nr:hypothetical protein [Myxococcales bacterium]
MGKSGMMYRRTAVASWVALALASLAAACVPDLDTTRVVPMRGTFGETLYGEGCQRVAYTGQLEEQATGLRATVDVTGETYRAVCWSNIAAQPDAPAKVKAIQGQRARIVAAVDRILPKEFLAPLESFLEAIVLLADDGTMEEMLRRTATLLATLRDDSKFLEALSHFGGREGYRPLASADLIRTFIEYPALDDFLVKSLDLFLDKDDRATPEFSSLLAAISKDMRSAVPLAQPASPGRTLKLALDLLFSTHPDFGAGTPKLLTRRDWRGVAAIPLDPVTGKLPAPFVDNNGDGLADVDSTGRFRGGSGVPLTLGTPFTRPGDQAKRDAQGRVVDDKGKVVFSYLDLEPTFLAAAARESTVLLDPTKDNALGLIHGMTALLGPRVPKEQNYTDGKDGKTSILKYSGFATEESAVLDLAHAFIQILGDPNAGDILLATRTLLTKYESGATRTIDAVFDSNERGKKHPEAQVPAASGFYDDLMPIIVRILRVPGLAEDLMNALEDPHVKGMAPMLARQLIMKDRFPLNQNSQKVDSTKFDTPVDYSAPDSDWNRSVMQRMLHLIRDANGAEFCNRDGAKANLFGLISLPGTFKKCEMFRIPDLGLFFAMSMADKGLIDDKSRPETRNTGSFRENITDPGMKALVFDSGVGDLLIEQLTGISGFTRFPTSPAAARSLFLDPAHQSAFMKDSTDPIKCVDGDRFLDVHNESIFAWEQTYPNNPSPFKGDTFYDAMRPIMNAFAKHDECTGRDGNGNCNQRKNALKIFLDMIGVLHAHWGSPKSAYFGQIYQSKDPDKPRYSAGSNIVSYERLTGEVMGVGDLIPALIGLSPTLRTMTLDGTAATPPARPALVKTFSYLFDPSAAPGELAYRSGKTATVRSDGKPGPRVTPYYLLADAYARRRAAIAGTDAEHRDAWNRATTTLIDQSLTIENMGGQYQMKNRRFHGITVVLIDFLLSRLAAHSSAGDRAKWVHKQLTADVSDVVESPIFAALADLVAQLEKNAPARDALYALLNYLVNPKNEASFTTSLTVLADQFQLFLDDPDVVPIARAVGSAIAVDGPDAGAVENQLRFLRRARRLDPNCPKGAEKGKNCTLITVLRNLFQDTPSRISPASEVADAIAEVDRATPGAGGDYVPDDYKAIFNNIHEFLVDEQRGFIHFVNIVKNRSYQPEVQP